MPAAARRQLMTVQRQACKLTAKHRGKNMQLIFHLTRQLGIQRFTSVSQCR